MRFYKTIPKNGAGKILAHSVSLSDEKLKKGIEISESVVEKILKNGNSEIYVAEFEEGDIEEDLAAKLLGERLLNETISATPAKAGRVNLVARIDGVLSINESAINRINGMHESITLATRPPWEFVYKGQIVATVKIITFAVSESVLKSTIKSALNLDLLRVCATVNHKIGLVQTTVAEFKSSVLDKANQTTQTRLNQYAQSLSIDSRCAHEVDALSKELSNLVEKEFDLLLVMGASAIMDRNDVIPSAITMSGGEITHFGMPAEPGNLMLVGKIRSCTILGLPGCARSSATNGLDLVLPKIMAGKTITSDDISSSGVGGLLKKPSVHSVSTKVLKTPFSISAVVLAAGRSTRMGRANKLMEDLHGLPVLHHVINAIRMSKIEQCVVVTGHESSRVKSSLKSFNVRVVKNDDYVNGLSTSIRAGLAQVDKKADGVMIILGDMPGVTQKIIDDLINSYDPHNGAEICVPVFNKLQGNPVLWSRRFFSELSALKGDVGGRILIKKNSEVVVQCAVDSNAIHNDIDTMEHLELAKLPLDERNQK